MGIGKQKGCVYDDADAVVMTLFGDGFVNSPSLPEGVRRTVFH